MAVMPAANAALMNAALGTTATPERVQAAPQQVSIDIDLEPGFAVGDVASLHHAVEMQSSAAGKQVRLQSAAIPADRDFELVWTPANVSTVAGTVFAQRSRGETYVLLMLSPPNRGCAATDRSGVASRTRTVGSDGTLALGGHASRRKAGLG
jgi:hypothetical protein